LLQWRLSLCLLGTVAGFLAILGVLILPITSADPEFRSARLLVVNLLTRTQNTMAKRLLIAIPMFILGLIIAKTEFRVIWHYSGWTNQTTTWPMPHRVRAGDGALHHHRPDCRRNR